MEKLARYFVGILGGVVLTTGSAGADNSMVVVVDATGSMLASSTDCDGVTATNRFETAKCWAEQLIDTRNTEDGLTGGVQVYTFHNNFFTGEMGLVDQSSGFVTPFTAIGIINGLTMPTGTTPLAGSMCDAIDVASASGATDQRFLAVFTDGGENDTDPMHSCAGPASTIPGDGPPFQSGSWQNKVWLRAQDATPSVTIDAALLFNDVTSFSMHALTDREFYGYLAAGTGGTFTAIGDNSGPPEQVPVFADIDGDFDVDRDDAIQLALLFGNRGAPELAFDADPQIGFSDYEVVLSRFGTGHNAPEADPYNQADTVTCGRRNERVVINGKVIEDAGVTVSVRGECTVVIRNSLIVSGTTAVRVRGGADLVVEDSIIVGEGAWLDSRGTTSVSASGSIFHGFQEVRGSFEYEDLGGNTFSLPGDDGTESGGLASRDAGDDFAVGCSVSSGARSSLWLALLVAVLVVRRRRRR